MSPRDELAKLIYDRGAYCGLCGYESYVTCKDCREVTRDYADAVIADGYRKPRTLLTLREMDALPVGTVVYVHDDTFHTTEKAGWLDVQCSGCRQGVTVPTSEYGRRLADVFPHIHVCAVTI